MGAAHELAPLMGRVAAGDRAAFQELYRATNAKLYGIILRILLRQGVADEVLQEVYVKIWERAGDFDASRASPITWMATIARNRALDEARRATPISTEDLPEGFELAADLEHPLAAMERSDELRRLLACLDQLEPKKRDMVLLAYHRGMTREALAQRFGAPTPTIKTWLQRSLSQLKNCLAS